MNSISSATDHSVEALVGQVADEFVQRLNRGEQPDIEDYVRRHPEIDAVLRQVLAALKLVRVPGEDPAGAEIGGIPGAMIRGCLGDFRILREVGRGGMGVVYEVEQISLNRRVALKVLPFAAAMDPKQLLRFQNEAQAAAQLHHQNIVPVYGVGCERGVHYYAMQYIEGQTLAASIRQLRHEREGINQLGTRFAPAATSLPSATAQEPTSPAGVISTERSTKQPGYFRTVARLGVQAAEGLEHAHGFGIIHRDVKPANLLVDGRGNLWITDFGLARFHNEAGLTMSGDLLGTLRYMSPEQALAKHGRVDQRTDIYSLGATLYELLTLQPAFPGEDRQQVLRQIERDDPRPLRPYNPAIPADLETIVLKALAKEPESRYASAQELADDLLRFLEDRPIRAKRPTPWQRGRRWLRRHRGRVVTAGLSAFVVLGMSLVVILHQLQRARQAETDRTQERDRALRAEQEKTDELCRAELALAGLGRLTGQAGQHFHGLERIRRAIELRGRDKLADAQVLDLRNEAIACLSTLDARPLRLQSSAEEYDFGGYAFDPGLEHYTYIDRDWQLIVRRMTDNQVVRTFPPMPRAAERFWWTHALFSPDGRFVAVVYHASKYNSLHACLVWDLRTGQRVLEKEVRERVDFHPDSGTIAMHTGDGNITLYRLLDGGQAQRIELKESAPLLFSFDATGRKIACQNNSKESLQILDLQTSKVEVAFPSQPAPDPPAWSPDGRWVAIGRGNRVHVFDTVQRRLHSILGDREASVAQVAFSPADGLLATTGYDWNTRLWDPISGKQWVRLEGNFLRFSSDGRRLAFRKDGIYGIWELAGGRVCRTFHHGTLGDQTTREDIDRQGTWEVGFSGDGNLLASASHDGVRLWNAAIIREVNHLAIGHTESVQFDPRGGGFVTHGVAGLLYWPLQPDPDDPQKTWRVGPAETLYRPGSARAPRAAWDRQGHWLAFTDAAKRGAVLLNMEQPGQPIELPDQAFHEQVLATALSPDGRWAAASFWSDPRVRVWETRAPKRARYLPGTRLDNHARLLGFSPDNQWLIVGGIKGYRWWRTDSWEPGPALAMQQISANCAPLAFTRDSAVVAIARTPHTVQLVDAANPDREFATLTAPDRHVISWLAFNPDGTQLAVAAKDDVIQLWDLRLLHRELAELGLDWHHRPFPLPSEDPRTPAIQVTVLPGDVRTGDVIGEHHLEAEDLPIVAAAGQYRVAAMDRWFKANWSNGRILYSRTPQGGYVEFELDCPVPGRHLVDISFAAAPDYGIVAVSLDGNEIGKSFDGYRETVSPSGPVAFGAVELSEGRHRLRFTAVDKNPKSTGYFMGIDYLTLRRVR